MSGQLYYYWMLQKSKYKSDNMSSLKIGPWALPASFNITNALFKI